MSAPQLVWFRNDLRVHDNPALHEACQRANQQQPVIAVVLLTPQSWDQHDESFCRMGLWRDQLKQLRAQLNPLSIPLKVLSVDHFQQAPDALHDLAQRLNAGALHFNYEYPLNERERDKAVCETLASANISCFGYHGDLIVPPGQVVTGQGTPYKVFTPFSRAWLKQLPHYDRDIFSAPKPQCATEITSDEIPDDLHYGDLSYRTDLWPVGEDLISDWLQRFIDEKERDYANKRDFPQPNPEREGTSRLSPYLSIGAISARQCLALLKISYSDQPEAIAASTWLNELIWREFYRHLLVSFPEMSRLEPFKPEIETRISWQANDQAFEAWCRGETGFPIVDAAMKQLLETGWMHNRLRMVVSSFLTKLLRVDWRRGERFFMRHLIDADFASNLGGWQWSASVGADAAPYFRIFNPQAQSEKFAGDGRFIGHFLPELAALDSKAVHKPGAGAGRRPRPIIEYKAARQAALDDYNAN